MHAGAHGKLVCSKVACTRTRWVSGGSDLASSPSAADAMDVGLDVPRHVKVDDVRDALNIEAARRHVRCKHERRLVVHEAL